MQIAAAAEEGERRGKEVRIAKVFRAALEMSPLLLLRRQRPPLSRGGGKGKDGNLSETGDTHSIFMHWPQFLSLFLTCAPLDDHVAGLDVVDDEVLRLGDRHHRVAEQTPANEERVRVRHQRSLHRSGISKRELKHGPFNQ